MRQIITIVLITLCSVVAVKAQQKNYEPLIYKALARKDSALAVTHLLAKLKETDPKSLGPLEAIGTNNQLFNILFMFSKVKGELNAGIKFMEKLKDKKIGDEASSGQIRATFIDTYANLLYKAGKVGKAIRWEKKAVDCASPSDKESMMATLRLMEKGAPTWSAPGGIEEKKQ